MQDDVVISIKASAPRRGFGIVALLVLGGLLLYTAMVRPPQTPVFQGFIVVMGLSVLWLAARLQQATSHTLDLTETELRSSDGTTLARLDDIKDVDRSTFAFKPSNGFIIRLKSSYPMRWQPGMWWCLGRRIGVGGVTSAAQTKAMAEIIAVQIAQRDAG